MIRSVPGVLLFALTLTPLICAAQELAGLSPATVRAMAADGKDLSGSSLSGLDLSALQLANARAVQTNWTNAILRGATFRLVDMQDARFDEVIARGAVFDGCVLVNATLRHADLSGAQFLNAQLAGADFTGSRLRGAEFEGCTYSRTGGFHAGAVAAALGALSAGEQLTGAQTLSADLAAGLTGEPFAFVYDTEDPTRWPMAPFTESPVRAAAMTAGHNAKAIYDASPADALQTLTRSLKAGKICLLPVSLQGEEMSGSDFDRAFWGAAVAYNDNVKPPRIVVIVPPFGKREYEPGDLVSRWSGPWPTLEPAGAERSQAKFPLYVLTRGPESRSMRTTVLWALEQAIAMVREPRTYATLVPGLAGLKRLAGDLQLASQPETDPGFLARLAPWSGRPRDLLISARKAAADFLDAASAQMLEADRPLLNQAAGLYRGEAQILEENFPALNGEQGAPLEVQRQSFAKAAAVINEAVRIESTAAEVLEQVGKQ
ncbi:MAG: pentapeptide repeat-containing protein [Armatimonadetes bacterium]|nr:pentapeptide repeat-containing protein [Armatimonadota bacterium]